MTIRATGRSLCRKHEPSVPPTADLAHRAIGRIGMQLHIAHVGAHTARVSV